MSFSIKLFIFDWGRTLYNPETKELFPDTISVLEYLAPKYQLAIVALATAGGEAVQERRHFIKENGLERYFTSILFGEFDKNSLYERTLKELDVRPQETIIVDDRVIRGIAWGNKNEAVTVWFQNGKYQDELSDGDTDEPHYTIRNLLEIKDIADKLSVERG